MIPTTENIAIDIWRRLEPQLPGRGAACIRVRCTRLTDLYVDYFGEAAMIRLTRRYRFSASHRLHSPQLERGREPRTLREVQQSVRARAQLRAGGEVRGRWTRRRGRWWIRAALDRAGEGRR